MMTGDWTLPRFEPSVLRLVFDVIDDAQHGAGAGLRGALMIRVPVVADVQQPGAPAAQPPAGRLNPATDVAAREPSLQRGAPASSSLPPPLLQPTPDPPSSVAHPSSSS